jgi:AraC-type transcriptional regulator N-terminus
MRSVPRTRRSRLSLETEEMHLEGLIEQASRTIPLVENSHENATRPVAGLVLLWQSAPSLSFGPGECLLVSHDPPGYSRITKAPYLALVLEIDVATIRKPYDEVAEAALGGDRARAATTHRADRELLDAMRRYLALAESPADAKVLGPLVSKEIHYRLLTAPYGGMLRSLIRYDSNASAIARAISHIRGDIRSPIAIPDLARRVGMSASSFHKDV